MEHQLNVEIADPNPSLPPGGRASVAIHVRNGTAEGGRFRLAIAGLPPSWVDLGDAADGLQLAAGESSTVTVTLQAPASAAAASLPMVVSLTADHDPDLGSATFGAVTIAPVADEVSEAPEPAAPPIVAPTVPIDAEPPAEPAPSVEPPSSPEARTEPLPIVPAPAASEPTNAPPPPNENRPPETVAPGADDDTRDQERPTAPLPVVAAAGQPKFGPDRTRVAMLGAVGAVALIALLVAAWFFLLRDDEGEASERPVMETAGSMTIQPRGDQSVVFARAVSDDPNAVNADADWVEIAEQDAAILPGIFATLMARSPDQQQVLFVTADDEQLNNAEMWLARADGSDEPRRLATIEQGLWPASPAWSPDGSRIAFAMRDGSSLRLVTIPAEGGDLQPVDPTPTGFDPDAFYGANPSPLQWIDNQTIGFYTPTEGGGRQLHQVDVESGRTQVFDAPPVPQQAGDLTTPCLDAVFSQNDPRWSAQTLAPVSEQIGVAGCGLTAAASVLATFDTGADPGALAECLNAEESSAPIDWATVPACSDGAVTFSEPAPFSFEEINRLLSGGWPVIVRLKGGPTGEHFVVVNTGPGSGSGLASEFRVTDPWDGTTWKTLAFFTAKGYIPDALIVYQGQPTTCTVTTGVPPQQVQLISPPDQSVSSDAQTFEFTVQGAAESDVIESSIDDGERIDEEGVHLVTITARREGEEIPYLIQTVAFTIDRTAPQSEASIAGSAEDDETYQGPVTIDLSASDNLSAVSRIEYRVDGEETWQTYSTDTVARPIDVAGAGEHTVEYRSIDMAGNEEEPRELTFEIIGGGAPASPTAEPTATAPVDTPTVTATTQGATEVVPPVAPATPPLVEATTTVTATAAATATAVASPIPPAATASATSAPATATATATTPASPIAVPTSTATATGVATPTTAASPSATSVPTATATRVPASPTAVPTRAVIASPVATSTPTPIPPVIRAATPMPTVEEAATPSEAASPRVAATTTPIATSTTAPPATPTNAATATATATTTATAAATATPEPTATSTLAATATVTATASATATGRPTMTATPRPTSTATPTPAPTATSTATATATPQPTATATATATAPPTATPSPTPKPTSTSTPAVAATVAPLPTVPPVPAVPTRAPASPTAEPTEAAAQECRSPVESDPGVELSVVSDLRLSTTDPGQMRLLGQITNDGDEPVEVIITICLEGVTYRPAALAGAILPGESAPFVYPLEGDDPEVEHGVAVSGFVISEDEIAETQPNVVIVDEQIHEPDASHPTMWVSLTFRNDGEIPANIVQAAVVLYQGNGDLREVRIFNIRLENPEAGVVGLEQGQSASTEFSLEGIRSMSGEYEIRVIGIAEPDDEGTPTDE